MNQAIRLCGFTTLTQAQEFDEKNLGAAPGVRKSELGALYTPDRIKTDLSHNAEKIAKDL